MSVMKAGEVTAAIHDLAAGDQVGVRAPLGNWFPYEQMKGKKILFIGGGIGLAPLRTLILFMLDNRADYGDISIIYGSRSYPDLCYKTDLEDWGKRGDVNLILTVDAGSPGAPIREGFVPTVLADVAPKPEDTIAITCGPPIMIKYVLENLVKLGFKDEQIVTTLEARMKCGIGLCGRCNIGGQYICKDGPVFTLAQLKALNFEICEVGPGSFLRPSRRFSQARLLTYTKSMLVARRRKTTRIASEISRPQLSLHKKTPALFTAKKYTAVRIGRVQ